VADSGIILLYFNDGINDGMNAGVMMALISEAVP